MARRKPADPNAARDAELLEIAQRQFRIETLETQNWDRLDFHDVAVWAIRAALEAGTAIPGCELLPRGTSLRIR